MLQKPLINGMTKERVSVTVRDRVSIVGIASRYGLDGPGFEPRWARVFFFFIPVQTGSEAHPSSPTMGAGALFLGHSGRDMALVTLARPAPRVSTSRATLLLPLCTSCGIL